MFNTAKEALDAANLNWAVGLEQLKTASGVFVDGHLGVVRSDNSKVLGVVGERYVTFQNADALSFFDGVINDFGASYVKAGQFKGGRLVYVQAKLSGEIVIPGFKSENIEKYLTLTTSHDGSKALKAGFWGNRISCQNSFIHAHSNMQGLTLRHTPSMTDRLVQARDMLRLSAKYFDAMGQEVSLLANTKFTDLNMSQLASRLLPASDDGVVSTRTANTRDTIQGLFVHGRGHESIRGTAWAAFNAVTEYVDHHRATRTTEGESVDESRKESAWFGSGFNLKQEALTIIKEISA